MRMIRMIGGMLLRAALLTGLTGVSVPATAQSLHTKMAPANPAGQFPDPVLVHIPDIVCLSMEWRAFHMTMTPDGKTLYFLSHAIDREMVMETRFVDGAWSRPEVPSFSGLYGMETPSISPDGRRFFFYTGNGGLNVMDKTETGWSEPRALGEPVNQSGVFQAGPTVAANGNLYFTSDRDGRMAFFLSRWRDGRYDQPEKQGQIFDPFGPLEAAIAPDESFFVFSSRRAGGSGSSDLYVCFKEAGKWASPRNLGPKVNSRGADFRPYVSADGKFLFFSSNRDFAEKPLEKRLSYPELQSLLKGPLNGVLNFYRVDIGAVLAARDGK